MHIALLGYGKMGKMIERIAVERGHEVVLTVDENNRSTVTGEQLRQADVAIEFSAPAVAVDNYKWCFENGVPVVSGTTGWLERWEEVVMPITSGKLNGLLYKRWVKQRAADVEKWSKGRLGYVHIQSMGDDSFRTVYSDILGKYNNCEGIVIDTRFNGGGRLHEDIEVLFSGQKYFTQVVRGREACDMPSRRWNKPSIMLQCEANYSNAHGTPWVYKHQKIGKLVGMPVPGTMTSVSWETLQDPSLVFGIPIIGYRLPDGSYLENTQLEPDVKVANNPETVVKGEDIQLKVAVDELLKEIDGQKK